MMYPLVRDLAASDAPVRVPVAVTCRVLGFSQQAYYKWLAHPVSDRDWEEAHLINRLRDAHAADPEFGHRLLADELRDRQDTPIGTRRAWRLCSQEKLFASFHRKAASAPRSGPPVHDDLVNRDFTATAPNAVWLTDVTEHPTGEGKLYICPVMDVFSRRIVGYSIGSSPAARLTCAALSEAIARRGPVATVVHSDRGSHYTAGEFVAALEAAGLIGSMGRVGACGDNAAMESFNSLLQKNVLNRQRWDTREELRAAVVDWIERTYHRRRRKRFLGNLTPVEFETVYQAATAA